MRDDAQQTHYFNNAVIAHTGKYEYDPLYRLLKAEGRELSSLNAPDIRDFVNNIPVPSASDIQNYSHYYSYDALGNIQSVQSVGGNGWTRTYNYNTANNYLTSTQIGQDTSVYTYDIQGNMLTMPHLSVMDWDYKNQMHSATNGTFTSYYNYNIEGNRTRKVVVKGNIREERCYIGDYEIYRKYTNNTLDYERTTINISDDEKVFARIEQKTNENPIICYQYNNHIGSACLELDDVGQIISYEEYHSFGTTSYRCGRSETEVSQKRYKYCGKERDEETGFYYYGMRFYAGWLCRFLSVDALASERSWVSPYSYCQNNPIGRVDPTGALDDEYDVNIVTGTTTRVSDKGGSTTQHFNIKDGSGNLLNSFSTPGNNVSMSHSSFSYNGTTNSSPSIFGTNGTDSSYSQTNYSSSSAASTSLLYSDAMNYIGLGLSGASIATNSITTFGNLSSKMSLLKGGRFSANVNGVSKAWSLGFQGNQYVSSSLVATQKSSFLSNVKFLNGMKYLGVGASILGTGISIAQFANTNDPAQQFEYGFDIGMGAVGFIGLPGAAASGIYFASKPLMKLNAQYNVQATEGYSDVAKGQYNIMILPFK